MSEPTINPVLAAAIAAGTAKRKKYLDNLRLMWLSEGGLLAQKCQDCMERGRRSFDIQQGDEDDVFHDICGVLRHVEGLRVDVYRSVDGTSYATVSW